MDLISQTLKTLKFILSAKEWRVLCLQTFFVLVMTAISAFSIFYVSYRDGYLLMSVLLSLSIVIIFSTIAVLRFLNMIRKKSATCLRSILLKSVLTRDDTWTFIFTTALHPDISLLMIDWPSEKVTPIGFVPDFVIHHCLILAEKYYAKENEQTAR